MASGTSITAYLEAGLRAAGLRSRVIGNNVANLNTPGFRRGEVQFERLLAKALSSDSQADPSEVAPRLFQPHATSVGPNGNDVDLDVEVGEMIRNGSKSKIYLRTLAKMYQQMELAMRVDV